MHHRDNVRRTVWMYRSAPALLKRLSAERKRPVLPAPHRPRTASWGNRGLYAAWLGHSTVLLKIEGVTVLTDPVLGRRVGVRVGPMTVGLKRIVEPALRLTDLPKIDVILLSHAHMDHFDIRSLRHLEDRGTTVITAWKTGDLLRVRRYGKVQELAWGGRTRAAGLEIRAFPVNHWGARLRSDSYRGYNGYTIESGRYRLLFGGDTAATDSFRSLRSSRPFDLAIMPVGAYDPWVRFHCTPEQAWQMANDAGAEAFLPVHHQTFALSQEPYLEPIERVYGAAGRNPDRVAVRSIGQEFQA
jgi:L-ascorbate metabolism protein UlaG (beta-lactamase superfamily)